jgi:hypothetical protein
MLVFLVYWNDSQVKILHNGSTFYKNNLCNLWQTSSLNIKGLSTHFHKIFIKQRNGFYPFQVIENPKMLIG